MPLSTAPAAPKAPLPIVPRRMADEFESVEERFFFNDNALLTTLLVALSGVFPPGEAEFIKSVRLFADRIQDETLREQIRQFAAQEGHHASHHRRINEMFDRMGFEATGVSRFLEERLREWEQTRSPAERLAVTVVMEHVTATMAHFALTQPERFASLPDSSRTLIFWHAIEEIEHKAVAFDVYMATVGQRSRLRRRLLTQMLLFPLNIGLAQFKMLRRFRHRPSAREFAEAASFLWGRKGLIRGVMPQYLALLRRDFHPWDIDDAALVEHWKKRLGAALVPTGKGTGTIQ